MIRSTESSSDASSPSNEDTVMVYTPKNTKDTIKMSRDILEYEMNSGKLFQKEERVTRTDLVRIFTNAKQAVMTVKFYKKVDESQIKTVLNRARKMDMKDQAARKQIATQLLTGSPCELTCCLTNSTNILGRSNVIDLHAPYGMGFRQIDHRTIESVVLKNVKYIVK